MTVEICGMTLEEIERKARLLDRAERKNRKEAMKMRRTFLDIVFFASAEEYDFARKMAPELQKEYERIGEAVSNSRDDEEKKKLRKISMRVAKLLWRCCERLRELETEPAILWCETDFAKGEEGKDGDE